MRISEKIAERILTRILADQFRQQETSIASIADYVRDAIEESDGVDHDQRPYFASTSAGRSST